MVKTLLNPSFDGSHTSKVPPFIGANVAACHETRIDAIHPVPGQQSCRHPDRFGHSIYGKGIRMSMRMRSFLLTPACAVASLLSRTLLIELTREF